MRRSAAVSVTGAAILAAWLTGRRLTAYAVAERSMEPALRPGDWILGLRRPRRLRRGDVVVAEHPGRPGFDLVKRVVAVPGDDLPDGSATLAPGRVWLLGDNPEAGSVDSRQFGSVGIDDVRARLVLRYRPLPPMRIARRYTSR